MPYAAAPSTCTRVNPIDNIYRSGDCTVSTYIALRCVALRCVTLRCVALHCVALRCAAVRNAVRLHTVVCFQVYTLSTINEDFLLDICCINSMHSISQFKLSTGNCRSRPIQLPVHQLHANVSYSCNPVSYDTTQNISECIERDQRDSLDSSTVFPAAPLEYSTHGIA